MLKLSPVDSSDALASRRVPAVAYRVGSGGSVPAALPAGHAERDLTTRYTGFGSAECSLAIDADGTLFLGPAFGRDGSGVLRSRDHGATWALCVPTGRPHRRIQPFTYVDAETGRLYFKNARFDVMPPRPFATGYDLSISDDQGETWQQQHAAPAMRDWTKVIAGPAPADDPDQRRITYLTGPVPFSTRIWPLVPQRYQGVYRSRDGGDTWQRPESGQRLNLDPRHEPGMSRWEHINYGNGVVGGDGTLYLAGRHGRQVGVAVTRDAGANWTVLDVPGSRLRKYRNPLHYVGLYSNYLLSECVAVDDDGTMLVVWPDATNVLRGAWSADAGETWSSPIVLSAPGVTDVRYCSVRAKPGSPGTFAIAYYGRNRRQGRAFGAYLAETTAITDAQPLFIGGAITDPELPLYPRGFDPGYLRIMIGHDLNEMLQARYAQDGSLYLACAMQQSGRNREFAFDPRSRSRPTQAVLARLDAAATVGAVAS